MAGMSVFLAMAYSGNNGFDLIGTSSGEEAAWDNVADWCKDNVEGFPQDLSDGRFSVPGAVTKWLSDNDAAEEVTVLEMADVMFTPGAAAVTVVEGVCVVTLCDDDVAAADALKGVRANGNPEQEHWIVPLDGGASGVSEGDHDVTPEEYHGL